MKKLIIICFISFISLSGCIPLIAHQLIQGTPKILLTYKEVKTIHAMRDATARLEQQYWEKENERIRKEKEEKEKEEKEKNKNIVSKSKG
jgi:hypothetical protein